MAYKNKEQGVVPGGGADGRGTPGIREDHQHHVKFSDKKSCFQSGAVWLEALRDFENELHGHVERAMEDQLRFQDGRLWRSLTQHIKAKASGKYEWSALFYCYRFMTEPFEI